MKTKHKNMEKSFMGDEPILKDCDLTFRFTQALNWYNYYYDAKEGVNWLYAYLTKNNFNKDYINKVKKLSPYDIGITPCSIAKMSLNGTDIGKYADSITKKLDNLIERRKEELKDKPVVSVIDRITVKSNSIIARHSCHPKTPYIKTREKLITYKIFPPCKCFIILFPITSNT